MQCSATSIPLPPVSHSLVADSQARHLDTLDDLKKQAKNNNFKDRVLECSLSDVLFSFASLSRIENISIINRRDK